MGDGGGAGAQRGGGTEATGNCSRGVSTGCRRGAFRGLDTWGDGCWLGGVMKPKGPHVIGLISRTVTPAGAEKSQGELQG